MPKKGIMMLFVALTMFGFEKQRIAIFSIKPINTSDEIATAFLMFLSSELTNSERIVNIERSEIEKVFREQALQLSGCTSTECTAEMGRMLGADKILLGSLSMVGKEYLVSVRVVDVTLGSIVFEIGPMKAKTTEEFPSLAGDIVKEIEKKIPVIPEIVGFLGEDPVLDVGKNFGIKVGDVFNVIRITGVVKNKEGKVIYRKEEVIGKVEVKSVQQEGAICKVLEKKKAFAEGDFVKAGGEVKDKEPPMITHIPVKYGVAGKPVVLNANVKDNIGVREAYILFKGMDKTLRKVKMDPKGMGTYEGKIPGRYIQPKYILYSIEAKDIEGNIGIYNNNGKYFKIMVKEERRGGIKKWVIITGAVAVIGGGLVVYTMMGNGEEELPSLPPRP